MRTRVLGRVVIGGLSAVLVLAGVTAVPAAAVGCDPENLNTRADIDGDGSADVVVGMPWYGDASGAVDVRGTGSPSVLLRAGDLGVDQGEGDSFGTAVAVGDLDQDGCADLVIGAPAAGRNVEGQVHLVFGQAGGVDTSGSIQLAGDSEKWSDFGTALALQTRYDEATAQDVHDLYVGASGATVSGHQLAGEVFRYTIAPSATGRVTATLREVRSQDSAGVPGTAEYGDRFGAVLATTDRAGVLVGAPDENVGSVRDAGSAWFLRVNPAGLPITSQGWSQNSAGVPGNAEKDDHFGSVLGARGSVAVIGVPEEDSGSRADTGLIQVFTQTSASGAFSPGPAINQNTKGVPGLIEAGDRFGAAVAVGVALLCLEAVDVAVGVPGEDVGSRTDAGTVALIGLTKQEDCSAKALRQGSGLAGRAETGDEVGGVLGLTRDRIDEEENYADRLLIGVPKEDIGAGAEIGMVQPAHGGIVANGVVHASLTFSKGYLLSHYYGMVLSSPSN